MESRILYFSPWLECHRQALAIWKIHLPANYSDLGAVHNNIGCVYGCLNYLEDALEHYNLSLKIYQKSLPPNHAANVKTLENIGLVYFLKNEQHESLSYYEKAAVIYRHALPSTHPKQIKIEKDIQNVLAKKMSWSFHFWWLDNLKIHHTNVMKSW